MTTFTIENNNLQITVEGFDKFWALKSHLTIPLTHIVDVHSDPEIAKAWWKGFKFPGSNIPGILAAGTFYKDGEKVFWDVHDPEKTIVLTLKDENYQKLIIEVENPETAIDLIKSSI